jgi:hypothetical protein
MTGLVVQNGKPYLLQVVPATHSSGRFSGGLNGGQQQAN